MSEIKTSATGKAASKDFEDDSMVISSPVRPVIAPSEEHTELEKSSSASLIPDSAEDSIIPMELDASNGEELVVLEQAATKAQAAFRGYLVILLCLINFFLTEYAECLVLYVVGHVKICIYMCLVALYISIPCFIA